MVSDDSIVVTVVPDDIVHPKVEPPEVCMSECVVLVVMVATVDSDVWE